MGEREVIGKSEGLHVTSHLTEPGLQEPWTKLGRRLGLSKAVAAELRYSFSVYASEKSRFCIFLCILDIAKKSLVSQNLYYGFLCVGLQVIVLAYKKKTALAA